MFPKMLLPPLPAAFCKALADFGPLLDTDKPLKTHHKTELPYNTRLLSRLLTEDRKSLGRAYMSDPRILSAYLRYFLPWNIYRLGRLFTGLDLNLPENATVVDLGAGPLTLMLALWLSRPTLRSRRLNLICVDRSPKPMHEGLDLFLALVGGTTSWKITLVKGVIGINLREKADLLTIVNTVNELSWTHRQDLKEEAKRFTQIIIQGLSPEGQVLLVEPGTRRASRVLSALHDTCLDLNLHPLAPCPHLRRCPMPGREPGRPWCHFNCDTAGAPDWLTKFTAKVNLTKRNLSLSFLYMTRVKGVRPSNSIIRSISEAFDLPKGDRGQYACSSQGLTLLRFPAGSRGLAPSDSLQAKFSDIPERDHKSGAVILDLTKM